MMEGSNGSSSNVPPGFRFHPTEEELVGYYLNRKVNSLKFDLDVIADVDLYRIEPWDIQDKCKLGGHEEQKEWYFFSHKDRKYPTGSRTNRATAAGFWKATGRDKAVVAAKEEKMIGMRKTLVFYKGRAPNGTKTHWIMHEYRLQSSLHAPTQEEGWVVCRAFKKPIPNNNRPVGGDGLYDANCNNYYYLRDHHHHHHNGCSRQPLPPPPPPATTFFSPPHHFNHLNDYDQIAIGPIVPTAVTSHEDHHHHQKEFDKMNGYADDHNNDPQNLAAMMVPSYSFANMPPLLMRHDDDHDHMSHLFGCFPDL
ncbi:unnamed protein product [Cuscuta campestris]|uniref:NAC domain-containing protein n=1 Tax=Cuscuta campestris TaxID=132261 RepID=A0A484LYC6_9ASTE|nr:unnamed protein product [Cuscuta campestris]